MEPREQEAITAICLMAALADGSKSDPERERLKQIFDGFDDVPSAPAIYQKVILGKTDLSAETAALGSAETRTLAFEMAVHVCDADGVTSGPERIFLDRLRDSLGLDESQAEPVRQEAEAIAAAPLDAGDDLLTPIPPAAGSPATDETTPAEDPEVDGMIVRYSILNGALELLPQSLATMAILPLQMKMVYRIGARFGVTLDRGHIKEFLATVGVGLGSQVLEGYARNLLGGILKKTLGKKAAKIGKAAVGPVMAFATTWALGQVARSYYGGGRKLEMSSLKQLFSSKVAEGKALYPGYESQVAERARNVDVRDLLSVVRG
ncbi:hypothetical protein ABI59_08070 [Acidobacteria bacterium Mor1]|nr:hypothetical protein ABI59_08070 [Acidobacteria bacterium Mor1]